MKTQTVRIRLTGAHKRAFSSVSKFYKCRDGLSGFFVRCAIAETKRAIAKGLKIKEPAPIRDGRIKKTIEEEIKETVWS